MIPQHMSKNTVLTFEGVMALSAEQLERGNEEEMRGSIQKYVNSAWVNSMCPSCSELAPHIEHVQNMGSCRIDEGLSFEDFIDTTALFFALSAQLNLSLSP